MFRRDATPSPAEAAAQARIDRIMDRQAVIRGWITARAVSLALLAIAPVVVLIVDGPEALYYLALMPIFAASVWGQAWAISRFGHETWRSYALIALNFALLVFILYLPNPFDDPPLPPASMLRFGNGVFVFVMLAALAFSFSPRLVLWGGICAAGFSSLARLWMLSQPGVSLTVSQRAGPDVSAEALSRGIDAALSVNYVDPVVWIQEAVVFLIVAGVLAQAASLARRAARQQAAMERRGANLSRYLPAALAERMAEADAPFGEDRRALAAVLFTDVVGFTGWAEGRDPAEVAGLLREVHGLVAEEVFAASGVLDKFIGDGSMASFGLAPQDQAHPPSAAELATRALDCVAAILARMEALNAARAAEGRDPVRLSVGLHLGPVVVADVGSAGRMELATVGDAVNVASRMEALTRPLGCAACASAAAIEAAAQAASPPASLSAWRFHGDHALPGRRGTVPVWIRDAPPNA